MQTHRRLMLASCLFAATSAMAAPPKQLITHNDTDFESNAYVAGTIPGRYPTRAHSDNYVNWAEVRMACFGHVTNNQCPALIRLGTGAHDNMTPLDLGMVSVNLSTGNITPKVLHAYGYTLTVNGPGETTLSQDSE